MPSLWSWKTAQCPSLFPLVSAPPAYVSLCGKKPATKSNASLRKKSVRNARISAAFKGFAPLNLFSKACKKCNGEGSIECPSCKGSGKNKKNGNIFERWKCYDCQGLGLMSCPSCGKGGLTPEQRGER